MDIKKIVQAKSNCIVRSDADPKFYLLYTDIRIGEPSVDEDSFTKLPVSPHQCRLRDRTYSAPILVDIRFKRGSKIIVKTQLYRSVRYLFTRICPNVAF